MNELNKELNQLQSWEEESNVAQDNQIAVIESDDDESEQNDEDNDEDDKTLEGVLRKILIEGKDKFSRFADAKRTLHQLYEKATQLEIAMAMIFGKKIRYFHRCPRRCTKRTSWFWNTPRCSYSKNGHRSKRWRLRYEKCRLINSTLYLSNKNDEISKMWILIYAFII